MITLTKNGNAIVFTFSDNAHYLFDGTIEVPVNSLTLITDNSQMATFRKSASNDIFISATYAELGMSKSELESWFKENACGSTGGGGVTSGEVETMIETSLENYYDIDDVDAALSAKANTATTYTKTEVDTALANKADTATTYTKTEVDNALGDKADTSAVTASIAAAVSGKQDTLIAGSGITISGNVISSEGGNKVVELTQAQYDALVDKDPDTFYIITDAEAIDISNYYTKTEVNTALAAKANTATTYTKTEVDNALANKADTSAVTEAISSAVSGKADTTAVTESINEAVSGKQDTLVSGVNIKTINNESLLGEGNITIQGGGGVSSGEVETMIAESISGKVDTTAYTAYSAATDARLAEDEEVTAAALNDLNEAISGKADTTAVTASIAAAVSGKQDTLIAGSGITISGNVISSEGGGGKAIVAGRGIEVTTGATADTVSFSLPISAGTGINSIRVAHTNNTASGLRSFAGGEGCTANKTDAFAFGLANTATSTGATAFGFKTNASVYSSFVCGKWNAIANANTNDNFGSSGNTVFAVGNGWKQNDWTSGSANTHNALDIRQNGDIYFPDTDNTTYQNYYEKPMVRLQDMYGALGGLKLVKITQAAYDALVTKDPNTLYVIVD